MKYRILLVDDEPNMLRSLVRSLYDEPYEFLTAQSGEEALEKLQDGPVDVVISDEHMPGMGGTDLLAEIRRRYPKTIRMMLTGDMDVQTAERAILDGAVFRYFNKPFAPLELAKAIYEGILMRTLSDEDCDTCLLMPAHLQEKVLARLRGEPREEAKPDGAGDRLEPEVRSVVEHLQGELWRSQTEEEVEKVFADIRALHAGIQSASHRDEIAETFREVWERIDPQTSTQSSGDLADRLVLLVDDERVVLDGLHAMLRDCQAGFAVMSASDGTQALALIRRHRPDLVVTDVHMPGMSGLDLLLACRRTFPFVRFILMSEQEGRTEEESLGGGAVQFLQKPLDFKKVERTVIETLQEKNPVPEHGFLEGISVAGFVQLLGSERQSVCLALHPEQGDPGFLYLQNGEIVHASTDTLTGENAALELLTWETPNMMLTPCKPDVDKTIEKPIPFLIMEAMRRMDEALAGKDA